MTTSACDNITALHAIARAIARCDTFFAFRTPSDDCIIFGAQREGNAWCSGAVPTFCVHPFVETAETPSVTIRCDVNAKEYLSQDLHTKGRVAQQKNITDNSTPKDVYLHKLGQLVYDLKSGDDLQKVVLSNTLTEPHHLSPERWSGVYLRLCQCYKNAYVFVFYTPLTGFWIAASPEKLLSCRDGVLQTMSLAGTRQVQEQALVEWGDKERQEQQFVTDYISTLLKSENVDFHVSDTFTLRAGNVEHLCNEFTIQPNEFKAKDNLHLASLLHPTPAIAGLPKEQSIERILQIEHHPRRYYGGYVGLLDVNGDFDFYVNLRSMEFDEHYCRYYAGGGITKDSVPELEWQELQNKFTTLRSIVSKEYE